MISKIKYWTKFIILYKNWFELIINRSTKTNSSIVILRNNLKFLGSPTTPLTVVLDETFIFERYTPKFLKINSGDIVVDIGAHVGDFSVFASVQGAKKVYAYEPNRSIYNIMKKNILNNGIRNIKTINAAITDKTKKVKFFLNRDDGGNSIYQSNGSLKSVLVKSLRLVDIFKTNKISKVDFLKIDCEGSEGLIFRHLSKRSLMSISKISMEYHDNVSILKHTQINKKLKNNGFKTKIIKFDSNFGYIYAWK